MRLDVTPDAVAAAEALLSVDERARAGRFAMDRDRRRYTVARACLRHLLSVRTGLPAKSIEFGYSEYGKPRMATHFGVPNVRFNVSHCDGVAVYAFTHGLEVGIDIERVRTFDHQNELALRFLTPGENEALRALDLDQRSAAFFTCWTRKEALVKAMGAGLSIPLDAFEVSLDEPPAIVKIAAEYGDPSHWTMSGFVPAQGFVGALVVEAQTTMPEPSLTSPPGARAVQSEGRP